LSRALRNKSSARRRRVEESVRTGYGRRKRRLCGCAVPFHRPWAPWRSQLPTVRPWNPRSTSNPLPRMRRAARDYEPARSEIGFALRFGRGSCLRLVHADGWELRWSSARTKLGGRHAPERAHTRVALGTALTRGTCPCHALNFRASHTRGSLDTKRGFDTLLALAAAGVARGTRVAETIVFPRSIRCPVGSRGTGLGRRRLAIALGAHHARLLSLRTRRQGWFTIGSGVVHRSSIAVRTMRGRGRNHVSVPRRCHHP
jgi:hypothetical protein